MRFVSAFAAALAKVLADKTVAERFDGIGAEARPMAPEPFAAYLKKEYEKWTPVIKKGNIRAN